MSTRHYIQVYQNSPLKEMYTEQILGNNDFFDDDFYYNLGIKLDEVCYFDQVQI